MNTWRGEHSSSLPARGFPIIWNKLLLWYNSLLVDRLLCLDSSFLLPCKYDIGLWAHVTVLLSDCSFLPSVHVYFAGGGGGGGQLQKNQLSGVRETSSPEMRAFQNHHFVAVGEQQQNGAFCVSARTHWVFPSCGCGIKLAEARKRNIFTSTLRLLR